MIRRSNTQDCRGQLDNGGHTELPESLLRKAAVADGPCMPTKFYAAS